MTHQFGKRIVKNTQKLKRKRGTYGPKISRLIEIEPKSDKKRKQTYNDFIIVPSNLPKININKKKYKWIENKFFIPILYLLILMSSVL